jgi:hypothetical protein
LEQVGIRVVPISYLSSPEQILEILGQVNGVYMPGDSHKLISNRNYIQAFAAICNYAEQQYMTKEDYFPVFFMGKST